MCNIISLRFVLTALGANTTTICKHCNEIVTVGEDSVSFLNTPMLNEGAEPMQNPVGRQVGYILRSDRIYLNSGSR